MQTVLVSLWEQVRKLQQVVEQQGVQHAARIAALEERLARRQGRGKGSPPSEGTETSRKRRRKRRSSGRSPGGQPGHQGHGRTLLPVDQVDGVVPIKPINCRHCRQALCGDDAHPQRHQVVEVPPVRAQVTEYQLHTLRCRHCDTLTEAARPDTVPRSTFGPSIQAWVGLLSGAFRLSKRNIVALLSDAFGVDLALGSISRLEQHVAAAIAAPVEEAGTYVHQQPAINIDETSWREARGKAWLWTAVTSLVTVFAIRLRRSGEVAHELLGEHTTAVVGSDRYVVYDYLPLAQRQICWSHLQRTFEDFAERGGEAATVGNQLIDYTKQLFLWWHRVRDGTLKRSSFRVYVSDLRWRLRFQLWCGEQFADAQTAATCANLRAVEPALWTFVRKEGSSPPTTRQNGPCGMASCGAIPASAPTVRPVADSSSACSPSAIRCANSTAMCSITSPRHVRQLWNNTRLLHYFPNLRPLRRNQPNTQINPHLPAARRDVNGYGHPSS